MKTETADTEKLQRQIDEVCQAGGGTVEIPAGEYHIGSLRLYSHLTLHLQAGAKLYGSKDPHDYTDYHVPTTMKYATDSEYKEKWNLPDYYIYGMFCAFGEEDISVIGEEGSVIDGQDCFDPIAAGLLTALVMYIAKFTDWIGQIGVRPLWICPLVGLVLGDLNAGIVLGASLELVFIGVIMIGGSVPQDFVAGGILGCAYAILLGKDADIAVTLAVPLSLAFTVIFQVETILYTAMVPLYDQCIEEKNFRKYSALYYLTAFVHPLFYAVVTFLAVAFGTGGIEAFINAMPA